MGNHPGGVEPPGALKHDAARDQHPEMVWGSLLMLARLSASASSTSGLRYAPVYRAFYQQLVFKRCARERIKSENGGIYALCGQTGAQLPLTVTGAASPALFIRRIDHHTSLFSEASSSGPSTLAAVVGLRSAFSAGRPVYYHDTRRTVETSFSY